MDVARLNASHSDEFRLAAMLVQVRKCSKAAGRPVATMLDLPGPKLRVGDVDPGALLVAGSPFSIVANPDTGDSSRH